MVRALNERRPLLTLYVAARYLGQYSYAFKLLEQVSLQLFDRYEAPPHNSGESSRLPDGDFAAALEQTAKVGFIRNYKLIEQLAQYYGIEYHVFLQPEVVFEPDQWLRPPDRAIKATTAELYGSERVELMSRARERFPALFAAAGIPYTDIGTIGEDAGDRDQLYLDYCHLTPAGAQAVALRMLPVVEEMVLERWRGEPRTPAPVGSGPA
jgi:hypothetical protein